jgi:hypothetical protein
MLQITAEGRAKNRSFEFQCELATFIIACESAGKTPGETVKLCGKIGTFTLLGVDYRNISASTIETTEEEFAQFERDNIEEIMEPIEKAVDMLADEEDLN